MKKTFIILCAFCLATVAHAQDNGEKILDQSASKIKKSGNIKASFTATTFDGLEEQGSISGTMLLQDKKFQMNTPEMVVWYDGKTQWSYMAENDEVNVSEPTRKELQVINPYAFIDLYKKGYNISMRQTTLRNQPIYEVHLVANRTDLATREIYIDVSKENFIPLCIRARQGQEWHRISIHSFEGKQKFSENDFKFQKDKYPTAEIVDLR